MEKTARKCYYLGFDIGTDSVGYAVTDSEYKILNFNGKAMWGSRLFESANTAEERRLFRTGRRRYGRKAWRIQILQELFAEEISKKDSAFFMRMKESALFSEDKTINQQYSLFSDKIFSDKDFYKKFPSIYHLRKELIVNKEEHDVRLLYLALHHIVKHRGHFLFSGSMENSMSFSAVYEKFKLCMEDEFDMALNCSSIEDFAEILKDKHISKKDKNKKITQLFDMDKSNKQFNAIIGLTCGSKCKLAEIFDDESLKEVEKSSFSFAESSYDDTRVSLEDILHEKCGIIDIIKSVYDWAILSDILKDAEYNGKAYISVAKVNTYEKHRKDLALIKNLIKDFSPKLYKDFFVNGGKAPKDNKEEKENSKDKKVINYCSYVGFTKHNGKKINVEKCSQEDFYKALKKVLETIKKETGENEKFKLIENDIEANNFLPLQVTKDNSVIPYQIHQSELKQILENAEQYLPFLSEKDDKGLSISEKISKLFEFKIPYYVGPLNTSVGKNSWMERKQDGSIRPWNFEEMVDTEKSAEAFIRRMTNKCTYMAGKDVLPKNSLLYSEFTVLNELNNVKINGEKLPDDLKLSFFNDVFKSKKRVTGKMLIEYLKTKGINAKQGDLTGIDGNFASSLSSYITFKNIFGDEIEKHSVQQMIENIILWSTLYGEETKMYKCTIRKNYSAEDISDQKLDKVCREKFQGWGNLSRELLSGIEGADKETGEIFTVIGALKNTNCNFMQILSGLFTFSDVIAEENRKNSQIIDKITYETLLENVVASPAIKRSIWQTVLISQEIKKIMGAEPKKIFVEMARGPEEKQRTESRKNKLIALYEKCKDESRDWKAELESKSESDFRSIKLYLYYTQMGKCMYSGDPIDLSRLADTTIYDRDHIYPQSKTKDDSLDNLVLVRKDINSKKSDDVLSNSIQEKMCPFWKMLKDRGLISQNKFNRLMRKTPLTDEELAGFINRQLVETRQSSKIAAEILGQIYENSEIVYVKAKAVSDFRKDTLKEIKVRELNDIHHAKDAYLNIVVGNVYNEKFTKNPFHWLKENKDYNYSLNQMFNRDLEKHGNVIWKKGEDGTISTVHKYHKKNNATYTRYATCNHGNLFDQQIVGRDKNPSVPIKKGMDVKKYGGYKTITPAYFALIESDGKKGVKQRSIEAVPLYLENEINKNPQRFIDYCIENYDLINPNVIIPKIKIGAYMIVNGFPMHLRGRSNNKLLLQGAVQLCLDKNDTEYLKKVEKYIQKNIQRVDKRTLLPITAYDGITNHDNVNLYDVFCDKQKNTIYKYRPASQYETIINNRDTFLNLSSEEQCIVLNEILHLMQCKPITADLTLIGGSKYSGSIGVNKVISNAKSAKLIHQSVTGLFKQEIDLQTV